MEMQQNGLGKSESGEDSLIIGVFDTSHILIG